MVENKNKWCVTVTDLLKTVITLVTMAIIGN